MIGSKAEFARKYGYSRAAVTIFGDEGKLFYVSKTKIDFEKSIELINASTFRLDLMERHMEKREGNTTKTVRNTEMMKDSAKYSTVRIAKEKYLALQAKLDYEVNLGELVRRDHVEKIVFERSRQFRDGLMSCSRRIAPEIAGNNNISEIESILNRDFKGLLQNFSKLPVIE